MKNYDLDSELHFQMSLNDYVGIQSSRQNVFL